MNLNAILMGAVSVLALGSGAAMAQDAAGAQGQAFSLGEIVVTAPKPVESVAAVDSTTLSAQAIEAYNDRWTVNSAGTFYHQTGAYTLLNLTVDYAVTNRIEINAGARNLPDWNYALVDGFPEQGRTAFVGIKARY